jgi:hypothetical protein
MACGLRHRRVNDLEVFAGQDHRAIARAIELADQRHQLTGEGRSRGGLESGERLEQRP